MFLGRFEIQTLYMGLKVALQGLKTVKIGLAKIALQVPNNHSEVLLSKFSKLFYDPNMEEEEIILFYFVLKFGKQ